MYGCVLRPVLPSVIKSHLVITEFRGDEGMLGEVPAGGSEGPILVKSRPSALFPASSDVLVEGLTANHLVF